MLDLRLFGPPEILYNGKPLNVTRRVTRALLFFIASSRSPVSRAEVLSFFWPEADEETARTNLRESLARLRAALPEPDLILTTPETIGLDTERVAVDILEFLQFSEGISWAVWKLPPDSSLSPALYEGMGRMVSLYNPSGFLAGVDLGFSRELEQWRDSHDVAFRQMVVQFLDRLYTHDLLAGGPDSALRWLERGIRLDRWNDELNLRYLTALIKAGHISEARKFYRLLEELYRIELEMPLPEEVVNLHNQVFAKTGKTKQLPPTWPLHPTIQTPYVGQQQAFMDLRRAFASGGGAIVLGEAGIGKTRFVQEFFRKLVPAPRLLMGMCHDLESNLPFQPWIDLLRRSVQKKDWMKLPASWVAPMSLILPEMADIRGDVTVPRAALEFPRNILFEAVRQTLMVLSQEQPLFLFMDDVHWADEASLGLLAYLLEQSFFDSRRGFLIMTARLEEKNASLDRILLKSFPRRLMRVQLKLLDAEEVGELAHHVLASDPPPEFVERLMQDTGGNPFFVLETLQTVVDPAQRPDLRSITNLPLAGSVYQLIRGRVQLLSQTARDVLMAAAVHGSGFEAQIIEQVQGLKAQKVANALDELEKARLIQHGPKGREHIYIFIHDKIRECILRDLSPAVGRVLNCRIAEVIEAGLNGRIGAQAALLAHHYESGAMFSKAFDCWVAAALYASRLSSIKDAIQNYMRAERLIPRAAALTDEQIYQLYSTWSDAAFSNDDSEALERINTTLLQMGEERQSNLLIGTAFDGLSDAAMSANRFRDGIGYATQAMAHLQHTGNTFELMEATTHRGVFDYMLGQIRPSQKWFTQALAMAPDPGEDALVLRALGDAYYQLAITETLLGQPVSALDYASKSMDHYIRAGWAYGRVAAFSVTGLANYLLFNFAAGREACLRGLELAERQEGWRMFGYLNMYASMNELELGNLGAAWQYAQKTIETGTKYRHNEITAMGHCLVGDIYIHLNALPQAMQAYQQGGAAAGDHFVALENSLRLGAAQMLAGQPAGMALMQKSRDQLAQLEVHSLANAASLWQTIVLASAGQVEWVERALPAVEAGLTAHTRADVAAILEYPRALVEAHRGQSELALARLAQALPVYRANNFLWTETRVLNLSLRLAAKLGQDGSTIRERLQEILLTIEPMLGNAPLQAEWDAFYHDFLNPEIGE